MRKYKDNFKNVDKLEDSFIKKDNKGGIFNFFFDQVLKIFFRPITEILLFKKDLSSIKESTIDNFGFEIGVWRESDAKFFSKSNIYGTNDLNMLQSAELCIVVRYNGRPIHYTCIAFNSFVHPRIREKIKLNRYEAYVYGVYTNDEFRGRGITPKVFSYIHDELKKRQIKKIFSHVWVKNIGSQKAFIKSGYMPCGKIYLVCTGQRYFWVVQTNREYFYERSLFSLFSIKIHKASQPELSRIREELTPFIKKWRRLNYKVVLFGGGGHTFQFINIVSFPKGMITNIIDNDPKKHGTIFSPLGLSIQSPKILQDIKPNIIIVSSQAYQNEMIDWLSQKLPNKVKIVKLYPSVKYVLNR